MNFLKKNHSSQRIYVLIFLILMFLTFLTVFITRFHFSTPFAILLAFLVASLKGSLVVYFFMHLAQEKKWILATVLFALLGLFCLLSLILASSYFRLENHYVA